MLPQRIYSLTIYFLYNLTSSIKSLLDTLRWIPSSLKCMDVNLSKTVEQFGNSWEKAGTIWRNVKLSKGQPISIPSQTTNWSQLQALNSLSSNIRWPGKIGLSIIRVTFHFSLADLGQHWLSLGFSLCEAYWHHFCEAETIGLFILSSSVPANSSIFYIQGCESQKGNLSSAVCQIRLLLLSRCRF